MQVAVRANRPISTNATSSPPTGIVRRPRDRGRRALLLPEPGLEHEHPARPRRDVERHLVRERGVQRLVLRSTTTTATMSIRCAAIVRPDEPTRNRARRIRTSHRSLASTAVPAGRPMSSQRAVIVASSVACRFSRTTAVR